MKDFLHHLLFPRESNNHRSKLLHHESLVIVIIIFFVGEIAFGIVKDRYQNVLGDATDISSQVLLSLTNQQREKNGVSPLVMNDKLTQAATYKAKYMFANNFWAHNAPDGTTPWYFIKQAGYDYMYAGENLARGFSTSKDVVDAWMNSPSHRENVLSPNYKDIGFAVSEGTLLNEHTTLVVEMFGSLKQPVLNEQTNNSQAAPAAVPEVAYSPQTLPASVVTKPLVDSFTLAKYISIATLGLFIFVFISDMIIVERKKIVRFVGHNLDHIIFLSLIFFLIIMGSRGAVLQ